MLAIFLTTTLLLVEFITSYATRTIHNIQQSHTGRHRGYDQGISAADGGAAAGQQGAACRE